MRISTDLSAKLRRLETTDAIDWIRTLHDIGEDPATFFQNGDWSGCDFSISDMNGISFRGAIVDGCTFRRADVSNAINGALSAIDILEAEDRRGRGKVQDGHVKSSLPYPGRLAHDLDAILMTMTAAALEAGQYIMKGFGQHHVAEEKSDGSPVTEFDLGAEKLIRERLQTLGIAIIGEEESEGGNTTETGKWFFLVDPLDGTREFKAGLANFTVNIALIDDGIPVLGVVFLPAYGELFTGSPDGAFKATLDVSNSYQDKVQISVSSRSRPIVLISRMRDSAPELVEFLARYEAKTIDKIGSSIKFCRLAEGKADLYPCFGDTYEWDTAAGHAILQAAGGQVVLANGQSLRYGKRVGMRDFLNPHFIASGAVPARLGEAGAYDLP